MRQCCHFIRTDLCGTQLHLSKLSEKPPVQRLKAKCCNPRTSETTSSRDTEDWNYGLPRQLTVYVTRTRLLVAGHMGQAQGRTARYITSWNTHQLFHGKYQGSGLWGFFSPLLLYNDLSMTHTHTPLYEPTWNQTLVLTTHGPCLLPSKTPPSAPGVLALTAVSSKLRFVLSEHCEEGIWRASIWYYANYIF